MSTSETWDIPTSVGADRDAYARQVEPRPSRFADGGAPYAAWAKRADEWARAVRSGVLVRRHPGH